MIKNASNWFLPSVLISFLLIISACETVVDVDLPFEAPKITMNSSLKADSIPVVRLTLSRHILDDEWNFNPLVNAQVTLFQDQETYVLIYEEDKEVYLNHSLRLEAEKTYSIRASADGHGEVFAMDRVPIRVPISAFTVNGVSVRNEWSMDDDVTLSFLDPPGENFYEIRGYILRSTTYTGQQGEPVTYVQRQPMFLRPKNPAYERDISLGGAILIDDRLFEGQQANIDIFTGGHYFDDSESEIIQEDLIVKNEIYFELASVSRSYFDFTITYGLQSYNDGDPFAQPVRVYSNIENGFGIVMGSSTYVYQAK